jgi:hypothetical protein
MAKNPGPLLVDKIRGTLEVLPAWVRRFTKYTITKQKVDAKDPLDPDVLTGTLVSSELRQEVTDERLKLNTELDPTALPATRTGEQVLPNGQVGIVTETVDDEPQNLVESAVLEEGTVENVGDISMLRKVEAPYVFPSTLYQAERPEFIPVKFRSALPLITERVDTEGTATPPVMTPGDITRSSEQIRVDVRRDLSALRDATLLPVVLVGQELSADGQLMTVTETLNDVAQTTSESALKLEGSVENLGDGLTVKLEKTVVAVFGETLHAKERPEVLPPKFRAALPSTTTRVNSAGTAAAPTLVAGDVSRSSEQVRVGVKRDTSVVRNVATPPTLTGQQTTTEYGGEVASVVESVVADGTDADEGIGVLTSEVETLGDGTSVKRTVAKGPGAWPTLIDFEFDERLKVFVRVEKTVIAAALADSPSIVGGETTEYKGLDKWRSVQIVSKFDSGVIGTSTEREVTGRYSFPDTVVHCAFISAHVSVAGEHSISVSLDVDIKDGPSGVFPGRLVETVFDDFGAIAPPNPFVYRTTHGTISIAYVYGIFAIINGRLAASANSQTWSIPPSLHGTLNPTLSASGVTVIEGNGVGPSDPTELNEGDEILIDVGVEPWRFNTWIVSKLYINVPTLA